MAAGACGQAKVLPYASLSTIAFLTVVSRLTFLPRDRGGVREETARANVRAVLCNLIAQCMHTQPFSICIGLGGLADWFPPAQCIERKVPVVLRCILGRVSTTKDDARDFVAAMGVLHGDLCNEAELCSRGIPVMDLLEFVTRRSADNPAIFKQVFILFGQKLDAVLAERYLHQRNLDEKQCPDKFLADIGWDSERLTTTNLCKYVLAAHKAATSARNLSVSADDSRVGGRTRMLVCCALPDNTAWWCAPQVVPLRNLRIGSNSSNRTDKTTSTHIDATLVFTIKVL